MFDSMSVCVNERMCAYISTFTSISIDIIELKADFFPQYIHKYVASKRNKKQNKLSKTKTYNAVTSIKQI